MKRRPGPASSDSAVGVLPGSKETNSREPGSAGAHRGVRSLPVAVKGLPSEVPPARAPARPRPTMKFDSEGTPIIEGVRVPDDEDDKKYTWRNAKVVNGTLVPNVPPKAGAASG